MEPKLKKALFVITKSNLGGAQKYVFDLATSLPKDAYDVAVAAGGNGPLVEKLAASGIHTIPIPSIGRDISLMSDLKGLFELRRIFETEKPDIVHVNSSKVGGLGAFVARLARVPRIVFTCHGWAFNEERPFLPRLAIKFFSWLTVVFSHVTIAVSARDEHDGKKMPGVRSKIILVHNGVREPAFKEKIAARAEIAAMARKAGVEIPDSGLLFGAIGELHKNKGYEYMLNAFALARKDRDVPYRLVIMGEGEERKSLEGLIKKLGLETDVALLGFVKDAPIYLKAFDAFILTSIKEGLPYVIIEAGYAGLPVIATNVGGVREIIEDMKSGILVQTRKPHDIAQGISLIAKEKTRAELFGANLRQKMGEEFSLDKMVRETIAAYNSK